MSKIIKISILSIFVVLLSISMILLINDKENYYMKLFDYKSKLILEKEFTKGEFKNFDIVSDSSDIIIKKSNTDTISVKVYGDERNEVTASVKENTLYINNDSSTNICLFFCFMNSKIELTVPELEYNNLKIEVASGDINIEDIKFNDVNINSKSGDIRLNEAVTANLDLVSGDIYLEKLSSGKLVTVSGDINVNTVNDLKAVTISGDVKVSKIRKSCQISTTSGNILLSDLNITKNSSLKTISGDVRILKANKIYFEASTTSGDINIEDNNRFSEKEVKIQTTSGDIYVAQ